METEVEVKGLNGGILVEGLQGNLRFPLKVFAHVEVGDKDTLLNAILADVAWGAGTLVVAVEAAKVEECWCKAMLEASAELDICVQVWVAVFVCLCGDDVLVDFLDGTHVGKALFHGSFTALRVSKEPLSDAWRHDVVGRVNKMRMEVFGRGVRGIEMR